MKKYIAMLACALLLSLALQEPLKPEVHPAEVGAPIEVKQLDIAAVLKPLIRVPVAYAAPGIASKPTPPPPQFAQPAPVITLAGVSGGKTQWMAAAGIAPGDRKYVDYIIGQESGWCATRWQYYYGKCPNKWYNPRRWSIRDPKVGYGLCQSTPAIKMAKMGRGWMTDPVKQLKWCKKHMQSKYGSWSKAASFKASRGWW